MVKGGKRVRATKEKKKQTTKQKIKIKLTKGKME
jgi:hypothetical protein